MQKSIHRNGGVAEAQPEFWFKEELRRENLFEAIFPAFYKIITPFNPLPIYRID